MQDSTILLAKQDLMGFSQKDVKLLTQHHDIDKNDMAWLVAIKLHLKSGKALMPNELQIFVFLKVVKPIDIRILLNIFADEVYVFVVDCVE